MSFTIPHKCSHCGHLQHAELPEEFDVKIRKLGEAYQDGQRLYDVAKTIALLCDAGLNDETRETIKRALSRFDSTWGSV